MAVVTKRLGKPIKWIETRQENYIATNHGRDHIQDLELMGNRDGTITGLRATAYANMGAHLSFLAPLIPSYLFGLMLVGPYNTPNISAKVYGTFTNTTPVDAYRGAGRPEATYVLERMIDRFALEIGMDPAEIRRKNLIPPFDNGYTVATGVSYDSGNYEVAFDKALEMAGYQDFRQEQARGPSRRPLPGHRPVQLRGNLWSSPLGHRQCTGGTGGTMGERAGQGPPYGQGDGVHRLLLPRAGTRDHLLPDSVLGARDTYGRRRRGPRRHVADTVRSRDLRQQKRSRGRHRDSPGCG